MKKESLTPTEAVERLELSDKVERLMKEKSVNIETAMVGLWFREEITEKQYQTYRDLTFVEPNLPLFQYRYPRRQEGENFFEYWGKRLFRLLDNSNGPTRNRTPINRFLRSMFALCTSRTSSPKPVVLSVKL
jgi:hypothetical protein